MNEQRGEDLVNKVKHSLIYIKAGGGDATEDEINLIVSVLRNNIPFNVASDLNNNEVKL